MSETDPPDQMARQVTKSVTPICGREEAKSLLNNEEKVKMDEAYSTWYHHEASPILEPPRKMKEGQAKEHLAERFGGGHWKNEQNWKEVEGISKNIEGPGIILSSTADISKYTIKHLKLVWFAYSKRLSLF